MKYKANIVTATLNKLEYTKQSLPTIIKLASNNIPRMISVIDQGSTDGTPEYLQHLFNKRQIQNLILLPKNVGIAKAHNIFWKMYSNKVPYYGKVDNDIVFTKQNWLNDILHILDNCPSVYCSGHCVENTNGVPNDYELQNENGVEFRFKNDNLGGACVFFPPRSVEAFGYWNEGFSLYGEEDTDYGYRIRISGFKNAYTLDKTAAWHINEPEITDYSRFKSECRKHNVAGVFWETLKKYDKYPASRKLDTNSINEIPYILQTHVPMED